MLEALLFALIASSSIAIGGALGAYWKPPEPVLAGLLAFGAGMLISALAFDLFAEAVELGGELRSGLSLLGGAAVFVVLDTLLEHRTGKRPRTMARANALKTGKRSMAASPEDGAGASAVSMPKAGASTGLALLLGAILDGVPENLALGVSLVDDASVALIVAIFVSNLPEALVGAVDMREGGMQPRSVVLVWAGCAALLTLAVLAGRGLLAGADGTTLAVPLAFAGGAVIAALTSAILPEAFRFGGAWIALATAAGFFASVVLA